MIRASPCTFDSNIYSMFTLLYFVTLHYPCITVNSPFKTDCACITVYSTDYESKHLTMPLMQNHADVNSLSCSCIYSSFYSSNCYGNPPQMVSCLHRSYTSFNGPIFPNTLYSVYNPLPLRKSFPYHCQQPQLS